MTEYPEKAEFIYNDLREKWKHEDELINKRVTWLLQSQGFLFAAYGVVAGLLFAAGNASLQGGKGMNSTLQFGPLLFFQVALPASALWVLHFLKTGIEAAVRAMKEIKRTFLEHQDAGRTWTKMRVDVLQETTDEGAQAPVRLAAALQAFWLIVLLIELLRLVTTLRPPPL